MSKMLTMPGRAAGNDGQVLASEQSTSSGQPVNSERIAVLELAGWYLGAAGLALGHTVVAQLLILLRSIYDLPHGIHNLRRRLRGEGRALTGKGQPEGPPTCQVRCCDVTYPVPAQRPGRAGIPLLSLGTWMLFTSAFAYKPDNAIGSTLGIMLTGWLTLGAVRRVFRHDSRVLTHDLDMPGVHGRGLRTGARLIATFLTSSAIGAIYALSGIIKYRIMQYSWLPRAQLPFVGCNTAGMIFALSILLALGCLRNVKWTWRAALLGLILLEFAALIATQSRGAFLSLAVGLVVFMAYRKRSVVILIPLVAILIASVAFYPALGQRYSSILKLDSNKDRIEIWRTAAMIIRDHPIVGIGVNNFRGVYERYPHPEPMKQAQPFAHNIFLEIGASTGIPGLALFAWVVTAAIINGIKAARSAQYGHIGRVALALFAGLMTHLQVDLTIYSMDMAPLFFMIYGTLSWLGDHHATGSGGDAGEIG
ncbi:MAG TPA: O-antigen ligase family protein [Firmicutes bacterium]|nr:O-antigen ligase family protein [Bacillota bacterium]